MVVAGGGGAGTSGARSGGRDKSVLLGLAGEDAVAATTTVMAGEDLVSSEVVVTEKSPSVSAKNDGPVSGSSVEPNVTTVVGGGELAKAPFVARATTVEGSAIWGPGMIEVGNTSSGEQATEDDDVPVAGSASVSSGMVLREVDGSEACDSN